MLGAGVDDSKIGTAMLADGTKIVTYNGMPLYYWVKDMKPGDTTGQGVGSVWYVVSPDGKKVEEPGEDKATETPAPAAAAAAGEVTLNVYTDPKLGADPGGRQGHDPVHVHGRWAEPIQLHWRLPGKMAALPDQG